MSKGQKITLPFPRKYVVDYLQKIFASIKRGECITSVWVATAGRRYLTRFIVDNIILFGKEFPEYRKYLLAYIEPLDLTEESQAGYLRLVGKTFIEACKKSEDLKIEFSKEETKIFNDEQSAYSRLLDSLRKLISQVIEAGIEPVLFLGEIDELNFISAIFCNNLRSLWNHFYGRLHYVFLLKNVRLIFTKDYFGEELGYLFFQNVVYYPVSRENEAYLIAQFEKKTGYKLTKKKKKIVSKMCDGHPYFLKLAIESLAKRDLPSSPLSSSEVKEILRANYEIRAASNRMFEVQTDKAREKLMEIITKKVYELPEEELQTLALLGLVRKSKEGQYKPFCHLFHDSILKTSKRGDVSPQDSQNRLVFDSRLGTVIFRKKAIGEEFTRQEYELLTYFLKAPSRVYSRDEIAGAIWGKESYEKYSDWAIDQLISKLRKKLKKIGLESNILKTIRGRGYKLTQES